MILDNSILPQLFNHRSIRQFTTEPLTADEVTTLVKAAQHAPTSTFSQQYSLLSITDSTLKHAIGDITGHHWLESAGHYFIVIADQYRNRQLAQQAGVDPAILHSTDKFLASVFDAAIATENIVIAGESMGLGSTIMGSILNDAGRLIELLHLPELTFPLLGIAIGHPEHTPDLKPRLPEPLVHFTNQYQLPENFDNQLVDYDAQLAAYYQNRDSHRRTETFSHHITAELSRDPKVRAELATLIGQQGFKLA